MKTMKSRGFTLIELLVGLAIGLVATLAVTQVLFQVEGSKRTTTLGTDAQTNGALALAHLEREIKQAGYGFQQVPGVLGCSLAASFNGAPVGGFPAVLAPVFITAGIAGAPDTLRILASGKESFSSPLRIVPPGYVPGNAAFPVSNTLGVRGPSATIPGDLMLAAVDSASPCEVFQVTAAPGLTSVPRANDAAGWNAAGFPARAYGDGDALINLGALVDRSFTVAGTDSLVMSELQLPAGSAPSYTSPTTIYSGIVNMKALYGADTNADGVVDSWNQVTPVNNGQWRQLLAVRIAVVARSAQPERETVTFANPVWNLGAGVTGPPGSSVCGTARCMDLRVDHLSGWQSFRYKVFETLVPIRNAIWNN